MGPHISSNILIGGMPVSSDDFKNGLAVAVLGSLNVKRLTNLDQILDSLAEKLSAQSRKDFIDNMANNNCFYHFLSGLLPDTFRYGLIAEKAKHGVDRDLLLKHASDEQVYANWLFPMVRDRMMPDYEARILGERIRFGYLLKLVFNDHQTFRSRQIKSHTDYTIFIPDAFVKETRPVVEHNPAIMIDIFKKVFPENYKKTRTENGKDRLILNPAYVFERHHER